ncbi:uncharacterized protein LOC114539705 [Dendronephthya gigantea]|uniref:uncharacterized protein LOC114539705 n=1 Tax=Dendronephthya gigantea TaxID=151771 RepID=UPI00106D61B4|nr:uncharacterized protein LOC114539705 [Dendronephthya gigantea]
MPKRKKTKDFLEDLGSFEFDELSVSRTGKIVEENKRLELDFTGFLRCCSSEDVSGKSSDAHVHETSDHEADHLCNDTSIFGEKSDEEGESLSSHNKRKLRLLSSWRKEREYLIRAFRLSSCIPHTAFCSICLSENPEFRCKDCGPYSFFCCKCLVEVHNTKNYFHTPEKWQENMFVSVKIKTPKLINPHHHCEFPDLEYFKPVLITDEKGFQHEYQVRFCRCKSEACTLVELGLWPATPTKPVMAFTFGLMELVEKMFLVAKVSVQQCCASLPAFSNFPRHEVVINYHNEGQHFVQAINIVHKPIEIYRNMLDAFEEFRHFRFDLRELKDICPERDGENVCPACPKENGVSFESFDALFGLPRKKSSGSSVLDPVRTGILFADQHIVDNFVANYQDKSSESDCNNFLAGNALRSNQRFAGLDETGIFGRACRHEFPKAFVNLKHGERISYAVWLIKEMVSKTKEANVSYKVLYDISCILHRHLQNSAEFSDVLDHIDLAIPVFHVYGHKAECQIMYSPRRIAGFGLTDGEVMERLWSYLRGFASITKEMSPSRRIDALTDCLLHYGRQSKSKLGERLRRRMVRAMELQKTATKTFDEMVDTIPDFDMSHIDTWLAEEKEYFSHKHARSRNEAGLVERLEPWKEQYFGKLQRYYCLRDESVLRESGDDNSIVEEMSKLDKMLLETERNFQIVRWKRSDPDYLHFKLLYYRKRLESLDCDLTSSAREYKFMTELKKKYADGQAIASRIERVVKKHTRKIRRSLKERENICKTLHELDDTTEYETYTFNDVVSSLIFEQRGTSQTAVALVSQPFRQQILDCYQLRERCSEEMGLLEAEMKNVVKFYVNDIKILQEVDTDLYSMGDIAVVRQEVEQQKIRLGVLISHFQPFTNVRELVGDEIQISYTITEELNSYDSDSDNVGNDSEDEVVGAC